MTDLGKDVVAPTMLISGMVIGVRTMDKVSRGNEDKKSSGKSRRKSTLRKTKKKKSAPANSYYCRRCGVRHRNNSSIGRSHKRKK